MSVNWTKLCLCYVISIVTFPLCVTLNIWKFRLVLRNMLSKFNLHLTTTPFAWQKQTQIVSRSFSSSWPQYVSFCALLIPAITFSWYEMNFPYEITAAINMPNKKRWNANNYETFAFKCLFKAQLWNVYGIGELLKRKLLYCTSIQ